MRPEGVARGYRVEAAAERETTRRILSDTLALALGLRQVPDATEVAAEVADEVMEFFVELAREWWTEAAERLAQQPTIDDRGRIAVRDHIERQLRLAFRQLDGEASADEQAAAFAPIFADWLLEYSTRILTDCARNHGLLPAPSR